MGILKTRQLLVRTLFCVLSALILLSCTRSNSPSTQVKFSMSDAGFSQDAQEILMHVVVNVRGPGITGVVTQTFSGNKSALQPAPSEISLEVLAGPSRLIQYMGVYVHAVSGAMHFVYGDVVEKLNPGANNVVIKANSYAQTSAQGFVTGRFLRADGSAPTGRVAWKFQPPNGTPAMVIDQLEMFGGYFSLMAFENANFSYELEEGAETLFNNVNLNSTEFAASTERVHVGIGPHFEALTDNANTTYVPQSSKKIIYGFFGPGATNKTACWHDSNLSAVGRLYANAQGSTVVTWLGSQGVATAGVMRPSAGGIAASSSASCSNPDLIQFMGLNPNKIFSGIDSDVLLSAGPFLRFSNGEFFQKSSSGSDTTLGFQFKPGVFTSDKPLGGVAFFSKLKSATSAMESFYDLDQISCESFATAAKFNKIGESSSGQVTFLLSGLTSAQTDNFDILGCPFSQTSSGREYYSLRSAIANFFQPPVAPLPAISFSQITRTFNSNLVQVQWSATHTQEVSYYRMWISENPNNTDPNESDLCNNAANISSGATSYDFNCYIGANILSSTTPKYVKILAFDAVHNPLGNPKIQQMLIVPNDGSATYYRNISNNVAFNTLDFTAATAGTAGGVTFYQIKAPVPLSAVICSLTDSSGALAPPHDTWDPKWTSPCVFNSGDFGTWALFRFETTHNGVLLRDQFRISNDP